MRQLSIFGSSQPHYLPTLVVLLTIILSASLLGAAPRGMTSREIETNATVSEWAQPSQPRQVSLYQPPAVNPLREDWMPVDSFAVSTIIDAGNSYSAMFSAFHQNLSPTNTMGGLTTTAKQAIAKAPAWLRADLENLFYHLNEPDQLLWGGLIMDAQDPYVDEIAFSVAHSSVAYLSSVYANPQLMVENARHIYSADSVLAYVQVNDHGSALSGGDYYSTTSYWKTTADSQLVQVEVPRDIYYWYIVHPKLTDEIPAYINPATVESNTTHANNIVPPPEGQFWRSFLFSVQEGTYPVLADTLAQVTSVWNHNGTPGDAIHAIQWWINNTMTFTSNTERPHQPVRIYRKHIGRCGEYGDYTEAASRAALIPCTQITSASTDHVWNEFWEDGWVQWEPVNGYINTPLVYEDGWGKVFGSVYETRSDGYLDTVTDRYSTGISTITITVRDSLNHPIDGARVFLAIDEAGIRFDNVRFTDNFGFVSILVGDNRHYYVRVESPVGLYPANPGTYASIVDNSVALSQYDFNVTVNGVFASPAITMVNTPDDPVDDWQAYFSFTANHAVLNGPVTWDDVDVTGVYPRFYKTVPCPGVVTMMMTDADNNLFYQLTHTADAFNVLSGVQTGVGLFNIPNGQDWYLTLDNSDHVGNAQLINGTVVFSHFGVANNDPVMPTAGPVLATNSPNPFSSYTNLRFNLPKRSLVKISIYNVKGQQVRTLDAGELKAGSQAVAWDGTDSRGVRTASGVYYYRVQTGNGMLTGRMLLLK